MHMVDMVIRQQLDPFFMQQVDDCYRTSCDKGTFKKAYARADRHEYIAELLTLFVGCKPKNFQRGCHGCTHSPTGTCDFPAHQDMPPGPGAVPFANKSDLIANDPDAYALLQTYMTEIAPRDDDRLCWDVLGLQ